MPCTIFNLLAVVLVKIPVFWVVMCILGNRLFENNDMIHRIMTQSFDYGLWKNTYCSVGTQCNCTVACIMSVVCFSCLLVGNMWRVNALQRWWCQRSKLPQSHCNIIMWQLWEGDRKMFTIEVVVTSNHADLYSSCVFFNYIGSRILNEFWQM
jgi:hypothetical protein